MDSSYELIVEEPLTNDLLTRLALLQHKEKKDRLKKYLKWVLTQTDDSGDVTFSEHIDQNHDRLKSLGLLRPEAPSVMQFPPGSAFIQFEFTLAKPYLSRDDAPFYVTDAVNPLRKEHTFGVPMIAASSWKGLLRWTAVHTQLVTPTGLSAGDFAERRLQLALLFGDEKDDPTSARGLAAFLDAASPDAKADYENRLRARFAPRASCDLPRHAGNLFFYPTFLDKIDVEVINPHSRATKAGTQPIYLECAPGSVGNQAGAAGVFSLLYLPHDTSSDPALVYKRSIEDLTVTVKAIRDMMLEYGFSAKRTSGYGVANDKIAQGDLTLHAKQESQAGIVEKQVSVPFAFLTELVEKMGQLADLDLTLL